MRTQHLYECDLKLMACVYGSPIYSYRISLFCDSENKLYVPLAKQTLCQGKKNGGGGGGEEAPLASFTMPQTLAKVKNERLGERERGGGECNYYAHLFP